MGKGRSNGASGAGRNSRSSSSSQPTTAQARGNRRRAAEAAAFTGELGNERALRAASTTRQAVRPATNTATLRGGSAVQRAAQAAARNRIAAPAPQSRIARAVAAARSFVTGRRGG